ncbi:diaminohydroxyphosphoribosylaminopyrimidine deaminase [Formivibrio citricus]|uniref:Riboflavin biosynthesis protein RibD n=2 Tax=Formivibrio citricus TaxID=83765 RepID=A0A1I4WCV7_9NEIS|nr:diaminohydroxyphosphoribosylaminopyrimidine deaminase [Formivibrio citricus]
MSLPDEPFMRRALELAARGLYTTTPNPRVGCVIVRDGKIIAEGWHERAGEPHAEVHALRAAGELARGATAYVTLEPCSHHGRTPPCADALIAAGVARVVAAMQDPNPQVAGNGLARLAAAGIAVESGLLEAEARELNIGFVSRMTRDRPWLRIKTGCSLDGRTALPNGQSQWITSPESRADVQKLRARSCAMLTGIGTVLADDPQLTVRDFAIGRQPLRVVLDSRLRMPPSAKLLQTPGVLVVCAEENAARRTALEAAGAEVMCLPVNGRVDLMALLLELGRRGCNEVTVEAGAELAGAFARAGLVDEWVIYQAPVLIGDPAKGVANLGLASLTEKLCPTRVEKEAVGPDLKWALRFGMEE